MTGSTGDTSASKISPKMMAFLLLLSGGLMILLTFWLWSRYPSLFSKMEKLPTYEPHSYIYTNTIMESSETDPLWRKMLATFLNWCWSMRIGMSFGLTFGAVLHTFFRYFPLKTGNSVYLNTIKGILLGTPAGVCVNCAVPVACGLTRGKSKVELALGFMLSSPSLNVIVLAMIISAFPWQYAAVHLALIATILLVVIPLLVKKFHGTDPAHSAAVYDFTPPEKPTWKEVFKNYFINLWKLFKTAVPMMLAGALVASVLVQFIDFQKIFAEASFGAIAATSFIVTLLPAPIAMEVMVAHHLYAKQVAAPFVMIFLSTLGSYSMLPMIYLWQEVSRKIAVGLYLSFAVLGIIAAYAITWLLPVAPAVAP